MICTGKLAGKLRV